MSTLSTIRFTTRPKYQDARIVFCVFDGGELIKTYKSLDETTNAITNPEHLEAWKGFSVKIAVRDYQRLVRDQERDDGLDYL